MSQARRNIGPREFVQVGFDDDELTIEKIKDACLKHSAPQTGSNVVCDVLAGEQGPSCSHIKQVAMSKCQNVVKLKKWHTWNLFVFYKKQEKLCKL